MNAKENLETQTDTDQTESTNIDLDWLYELIDEIRV